MILPRHVTFTGLDVRSDIGRVRELSTRYPIEWGILQGGTIGSNRYPEEKARAILEDYGVKLAAHLCKDVAKQFMQFGDPHLAFQAYQRIQVNAVNYDMDSLMGVRLNTAQRIILQHRDGDFPTEPAFEFLLDRSGGRGVRETDFPPAPVLRNLSVDQFVGYAGGIAPDNVTEVITAIQAKNYWIDMETSVRTDDWLDLDKCEAVCFAIWGEGIS